MIKRLTVLKKLTLLKITVGKKFSYIFERGLTGANGSLLLPLPTRVT